MAARCTTPPVAMHHSSGNDAPSPAVMLHFLCGVCSYRKCMGREVVVQPNPRVYKALKTQMVFILEELQRIAAGENVQTELLDTIDLIAFTMHGLKGESANGE